MPSSHAQQAYQWCFKKVLQLFAVSAMRRSALSITTLQLTCSSCTQACSTFPPETAQKHHRLKYFEAGCAMCPSDRSLTACRSAVQTTSANTSEEPFAFWWHSKLLEELSCKTCAYVPCIATLMADAHDRDIPSQTGVRVMSTC